MEFVWLGGRPSYSKQVHNSLPVRAKIVYLHGKRRAEYELFLYVSRGEPLSGTLPVSVSIKVFHL